MTIQLDLLKSLQDSPADVAWRDIFHHAWEVCAAPFGSASPKSEIVKRDRAVGNIDLYLATAGWDLWSEYETAVPRTSNTLAQWWSDQTGGRAVLILDALSLREVPWLLAGAEAHGFRILDAKPLGAELPADTTPFAKALGFSQRSALSANGAGNSHRLHGATTEATDIDWHSCAGMVGAQRDWVFWHHWPDKDVHDFADPGEGHAPLLDKVQTHLEGDAFWDFASRLAEGRRLVITADHGHAYSGNFPDTSNKDQSDYLKTTFRSGRWSSSATESGSWVPPIDLHLTTHHGPHLFVNGRRKWKSTGGYPTLTHGGLTVLEVAVPFIELASGGGIDGH